MLTPYQHELIHSLNSVWATANHTTDAETAPSVCLKSWALKCFTDHTQDGITTEDGPGTDFEDVSKVLARSAASLLNTHHRLYKTLQIHCRMQYIWIGALYLLST